MAFPIVDEEETMMCLEMIKDGSKNGTIVYSKMKKEFIVNISTR